MEPGVRRRVLREHLRRAPDRIKVGYRAPMSLGLKSSDPRRRLDDRKEAVILRAIQQKIWMEIAELLVEYLGEPGVKLSRLCCGAATQHHLSCVGGDGIGLDQDHVGNARRGRPKFFFLL